MDIMEASEALVAGSIPAGRMNKEMKRRKILGGITAYIPYLFGGTMFRFILSFLIFLAYIPGFLSAETCGGPVARSYIEGFTLNLSTSISFKKEFRLIDYASSARIKQLKVLIEPLSEIEKKVMAKASLFKPYLVTRVKFDKLRAIFKAGGLLSASKAIKGGWLKEKPFTPLMEDKLFGGHSCVFASLGPPQGRKRYGDILFRLNIKALENKTWGTFSSGYHFLKTYRLKEMKGDVNVNKDDVAGFSNTVFSGQYLDDVYPFMIINFLRSFPEDKANKLSKEILNINDRRSFYSFVDSNRIGYMEAKIADSAALNSIRAIEVPADKLKEILSWPEAKPYKNKIHAEIY